MYLLIWTGFSGKRFGPGPLIPFFLRLPFIEHSKNEQKTLVRLHIVFFKQWYELQKRICYSSGRQYVYPEESYFWDLIIIQKAAQFVKVLHGNCLIRNRKIASVFQTEVFSIIIIHAHFVKFCSHHENTKHLIIFSHQDNYF